MDRERSQLDPALDPFLAKTRARIARVNARREAIYAAETRLTSATTDHERLRAAIALLNASQRTPTSSRGIRRSACAYTSSPSSSPRINGAEPHRGERDDGFSASSQPHSSHTTSSPRLNSAEPRTPPAASAPDSRTSSISPRLNSAEPRERPAASSHESRASSSSPRPRGEVPEPHRGERAEGFSASSQSQSHHTHSAPRLTHPRALRHHRLHTRTRDRPFLA